MKKDIRLLIASIVFMIAITIITIELMSRFLYNDLTSPSSRFMLEVAESSSFLGYDEVINKPRFLPHPYMLYELTPNYEGHFKTNSLGYRNAEFKEEKQPNIKRILALGGSTTYGTSVSMSDTWPSRLGEILKKESKNFEVINGGVDSASSAEILSSWIYKHRFIKPDIVILNLGINDIWPILLTSKYSSSYINFRRANSYIRSSQISKLFMKYCYFYRILWANLHAKNEGDNDAAYPYTQALDANLQEEEKQNSSVTIRAKKIENLGFRQNFQYLVKILKMEGIKVFISFGSDKFFMKNLEKPWLIIKERNEAIMADIAVNESIKYTKIDPSKFKREWYSDWYHMNANGENEKALLIFKALLKNELIN